MPADDEGELFPEDADKWSLAIYRHTEKYQHLLRKALGEANVRVEGPLSDSYLAKRLEDQSIKFDRSSIARFRLKEASLIKDERIARGLWEILVGENVISFSFIRDNFELNIDDIAFAANAFLETHQSQFENFIRDNCYGLFFGYKKAFRQADSVVKSLFIIKPAFGYLAVSEFQRSSPHREADNREKIERSDGFGVIKSDNLWIFMKERRYQQPRVFCFGLRESTWQDFPETGGIYQDNILKGNCLESAKNYANFRGAKHSPVMLVRAPNTRPSDWNDEKRIAELRNGCDLIPRPERPYTAPYQAPDVENMQLHSQIENYLFAGSI